MSDAANALSGPERAAILMMSLGEQRAAEVLKHMGPREVEQVGAAMAVMKDVSSEKLESVLGSFASVVQSQSSLNVDPGEYVKNVLVGALGEKKASGLLTNILRDKKTSGLDALKWMPPGAVADVIKKEHPQIIAIVLASLDGDHAAEVLSCLPDEKRADVLIRVATLDSVPPSALDELNEVLEKQFSGGAVSQATGVGGINIAADILNYLDSDTEAAITAIINERDTDLAREIQDNMFVFENLLSVDNRGIQKLLREIQTDTLILALKGADASIQDKIFNNMSSRAAEMLRDDLDAKGPVKLKDVEEAQKSILEVAQRLAEAGDISLGNKGGDEYV